MAGENGGPGISTLSAVPFGGESSGSRTGAVATSASAGGGGAVVTPKSVRASDPMHDKTVEPKAPDASHKYVWIDTALGGMWSLHLITPVGGGSGNGSGSPVVSPHGKVNSTNTVIKNGHQVIVTTYEDGTTSEQDYGLSATGQAQQQNWLAAGKALLDQYGVGSLWNDYNDLIVNKGYDNQTAMLALQSTKSWMDRFSANKTRLAQGLAVLDPATYLATEEKYKDVMISAGIDKSVYNDVTKLGDLISKDVSPYEVQQRIDAARFELDNKDPYILQQLKDRFGLTEGDIVLHMLDPQIASSVIAQKVQSAKINAEAARQSLTVTQAQADALAAQGISQAGAAAGFGTMAQMQQFGQALPGTDVSGFLTNQQMIDANFQSTAESQTALKKVQGTRTAEFQAGGGAAATAAGVVGAGANLAT